MILDATAGNRHVWTTKNPDDVIFLDKEPGLKVKPDVLASFTRLPFRDRSFNMVIFDPPWGHMKSMHTDPSEKYGSYWGSVANTTALFRLVNAGLREILRVLTVDGFLYLKFGSYMTTYEKFLPIFKNRFVELIRTDRRSQSGLLDTVTSWVLFARARGRA